MHISIVTVWIRDAYASFVLKRSRSYNTMPSSVWLLALGGFAMSFCECGMSFICLVSEVDTILPFQTLVFLERKVEMLQGRAEFFCTAQAERHWDRAPLCLSAALQGKLSVIVTHALKKLNFSYRSNGCFQDKNEMVKAETVDCWESGDNELEWKHF